MPLPGFPLWRRLILRWSEVSSSVDLTQFNCPSEHSQSFGTAKLGVIQPLRIRLVHCRPVVQLLVILAIRLVQSSL